MKCIYSLKAVEKFASFADSTGESNSANISLLKTALPLVINERLTERQRQCVERYYFQNKTMSDIASELGIERSTVSRNLLRARERIKTSLEYIVKTGTADCR